MSTSEREAARLKALVELAILDTAPEREFDALTILARRLFATDISSVTLIDAERQWFKARSGPLGVQTDRGPALCNVVVEREVPVVIGDASRDPLFSSNPFVVGAPNIRFYAGVPIRATTNDGDIVPIGTICVIDDEPRDVTTVDVALLKELACVAEALLEARAVARRAVHVAKERQIAVERLERERRQFKKAEHMADMGSWRYDLETQRTEWSDGVFAIHELPAAGGVPVDDILNFYPEPDRTTFMDVVKRTLDTGEPFEMDVDFVTAKGNKRRIRCMGEIELAKGKPVALIGLVQDISERHRMEAALLHSATTDDLTQLPNRAEFNRVLDTRLREARQLGEELAVALVDLDGFKGVNDTLGHAAGDDVLRKVAHQLRSDRFDGCFTARFGGDEFALLLPRGSTRTQVERTVRRLLRDMDIITESSGRIARVSGTVGVAWSGWDCDDRETILRRADAALYEAKQTQKGTSCTYRHPATRRLAG